MGKKIIDSSNSGKGTVTAVDPAPLVPKMKADTYSVQPIGGSFVVYNAESGTEVARFDKFADALAEQTRRNGVEANRGYF